MENKKIFNTLWNMDILDNLSVTRHKLYDKIIINSWISKILIRDKKMCFFAKKSK